jgi:hypothetical protein
VRRQVDELGDVPADRGQPRQPALGQAPDTELQLEVRDARHQVGVARALAVAVHRALQLGGPTQHGGDGVADRAARVVLGVDADLLVGAEEGRHLADDVLHLVGQRPAVRVAQDQAVGAVGRGGFEHAEGVLGVGLVPVEEVLRVEEHAEPGPLQELDRLADHGHALLERGAERLDDVVVPRLADDARRRRTRADQRGEGGVDVDLARGLAGGAEGHEGGGRQRQLVDGAAEELLVLGVGLRVAALDPRHAEPVELLGDAELVLDGEGDALELGAVAERGVEDVDRRGEGAVYWHSSTHVLYLSFWPRTTRAYSSPMAFVIGPGVVMARSSTELTADTSAAVPTTNISSQM